MNTRGLDPSAAKATFSTARNGTAEAVSFQNSLM